ncbi:MAG: DUF502 domain-containing protein [Halapricum sp.]
MDPTKNLDIGADEARTVRDRFRTWMVSGLAVAIPILITLVVFRFAMNFLLNSVGPLAYLLQTIGIRGQISSEVAALVTLLSLVFVVGFVTETSRASRRLEDAFDNAVSSIPGIGAVYSSFNEMSQLLLDSETQSFQEVKLVEYPTQGSYCVAFITAETSENICDATGNTEMTTLYLPMAPNPVMGGFVVHVENDRVYDVDMTVEEGMRSVVTSGVAVNDADEMGDGVDQTGVGSGATSGSTPANERTSM